MNFFGQGKRKHSRAASLKTKAPWWQRWRDVYKNRYILSRFILAILMIALLFFAVEGWKTPFSYRIGDLMPHGVSASIDFEIVNEAETESKKEEEARRVPFTFINHPENFKQTFAKLKRNLIEVARAESVDELPEETRVSFGIPVSKSLLSDVSPYPDGAGPIFMSLKVLISEEDETVGKRIDVIMEEIKKLLKPLNRFGVVDMAEINRKNKIKPNQTIRIIPSDNSKNNDDLPEPFIAISELSMDRLLSETGLIGKNWGIFTELLPAKKGLENWFRNEIKSSLTHAFELTHKEKEEARQKVEPITDHYNMGDSLVRPGKRITYSGLNLLKAEHEQINKAMNREHQIIRIITVVSLLVILVILNAYYLINNEPALIQNISRLIIYMVTMVSAIALGRLLTNDWRAEIVPLLATVMIFAIAYTQEMATLTAFVLAVVVCVSTQASLEQFLVLMSASASSIVFLGSISSRSTLIRAGFISGVVFLMVSWGVEIITSDFDYLPWTDFAILSRGLSGAGWCVVTGFLVAGSLPFIESMFGLVTDISLLEMSDVSHPLLQELVRRAPGTYNHSISVASIGETAAEKIGANGLLVRVGAYFHDIGKMMKPQYFIENKAAGDENPHDHLAPAMSTLIIIGHVKDGVDLAQQHNLPQPLIDFIEQHHGTTLVEYFYHEATKQADLEPDHRTDAEESSFRYPGPKPQSREAGVLMLADAVESASRTLSDPTPARIENLVHALTLKRLLDGQFDDSSLTLSEIHTIEESLIKSMTAVYHGRIKYPEQRSA